MEARGTRDERKCTRTFTNCRTHNIPFTNNQGNCCKNRFYPLTLNFKVLSKYEGGTGLYSRCAQ
jgi:hypothetical protein